MDIVEMLRNCGDGISTEAADTIEKLRAQLEAVTSDRDDANGCLIMIHDFLKMAGCECGPGAHEATPPMMYPEWIACAMRKYAATAGKEADVPPKGEEPTEKDRRIYYQSIVYDVCNALDRCFAKRRGNGVVCGTVENPTRQVQEHMAEVVERCEEWVRMKVAASRGEEPMHPK